MSWANEGDIQSRQFRCGFCGSLVATRKGFHSQTHSHFKIHICPHCDKPTFFDGSSGAQVPGVTPGNEVNHLPQQLETLFKEARLCVSASAYTASVLACRKLLMHIAVQKQAEEGKGFLFYVEYLADKGYVPPNGKGWVDHIRKKGNEAAHEIVLMKKDDAEELIAFVEMLLKFIYEFPARVPSP